MPVNELRVCLTIPSSCSPPGRSSAPLLHAPFSLTSGAVDVKRDVSQLEFEPDATPVPNGKDPAPLPAGCSEAALTKLYRSILALSLESRILNM
jgi:hypothetical protein